MKKFLFIVMALLICAASYAYDIAVENEDGVTIYYNYINDGTELEITYKYNIRATYGGKVNIPESVTYMNRARKVTSIGNGAFNECSGLTSVNIPNSVSNIGDQAFLWCSSLTSINIPNSVMTIGDAAFARCTSLTSVNIPNSVTKIGPSLFLGCTGLTSVNIPNSVTNIDSAFSGCTSLTSVNIPNSVTNIDGAFFGCTSLTSVNIPNSVTNIDGAFFGCTSLASIVIPNSVTIIGEETFEGCTSLASIVIPNSVTNIGEEAFCNCSSLTSIVIPNSVTNIGRMAFAGCTSLTSIVSKMENPCNIEEDCFHKDVFYNTTLYVPKGTKDTYKSTDYWNKFVFIEEGDPSGETPEPQKCSKPTIGYKKGQLTFNCATSGATCNYSITDSDIKSGSGNKADLTVTYQVSVYASKAGYDNSETAHATLCWIDVDPKTDGITNGVAQVKAQPVLIQAQDGFINITGLNEGQHIVVYQVDGKQVASANAYDGTANIVTTLSSGTIAIVKIGNKAVKVMMQ